MHLSGSRNKQRVARRDRAFVFEQSGYRLSCPCRNLAKGGRTVCWRKGRLPFFDKLQAFYAHGIFVNVTFIYKRGFLKRQVKSFELCTGLALIRVFFEMSDLNQVC